MINSVIDNNIKILNIIIKRNNKLKDIKIDNNKLVYKNSITDINKIDLRLLLSNNYNKFVIDIKNDNIYPENFIELIKINSYDIEDDNNYNILNKKEIININHFKELLDNIYILSEEDYNKVKDFQNYMKLLLLQTNSDDTYLNVKQKELLDQYLELMQDMLKNNNHNKASDFYSKMIEEVNKEKISRLKRSLSLEKKDGFVNGLLIVLIMAITGIAIGICTLFMI